MEKFIKRFKRYPSTSAVSANSIVHKYKAAGREAGSYLRYQNGYQSYRGARISNLIRKMLW